MYLGDSRPNVVNKNLEKDLAHAKTMLARARNEVEKRNWQGKIRVLTLALQDLKRQQAVNPRFAPGNRPADGKWFAEPASSSMKSIPTVPAPVERTPDTSLTASLTKVALPRSTTAIDTSAPSKTTAVTSSSAAAPAVAMTSEGAAPIAPAFVPESAPVAVEAGLLGSIPWWGWVGGALLVWKWRRG